MRARDAASRARPCFGGIITSVMHYGTLNAAPYRFAGSAAAGMTQVRGTAADTGQGLLRDMQGTCDLCADDCYPNEEVRQAH
jgi:hypothetical protein